MKIAPVVDSLDSVAEPLRELYVPGEGGKFVLDTDIDGHPGTAGLRRKNQELLTGQTALKDKYKAFEGLDPDDVKAAIEARTKAEEERQRRAGEFDSLKQQLIDQHGKDKTAWEGEKKKLIGTIEKRVKRDGALTAINKKGANATLLLPHMLEFSRVEADGDDWNYVIVDQKGNPRISAKTGDPMTYEELLEELSTKDDYKAAFPAPDVQGSGARANDGNKGNAGDIKLTQAQAKDPAAYRRAKEEAAKRGVQVIFLDH